MINIAHWIEPCDSLVKTKQENPILSIQIFYRDFTLYGVLRNPDDGTNQVQKGIL